MRRLPSGRLQSLQDWVVSRDERARLHPEELNMMLKQVASRLLQVHLFFVFCHYCCLHQLATVIVIVDLV